MTTQHRKTSPAKTNKPKYITQQSALKYIHKYCEQALQYCQEEELIDFEDFAAAVESISEEEGKKGAVKAEVNKDGIKFSLAKYPDLGYTTGKYLMINLGFDEEEQSKFTRRSIETILQGNEWENEDEWLDDDNELDKDDEIGKQLDEDELDSLFEQVDNDEFEEDESQKSKQKKSKQTQDRASNSKKPSRSTSIDDLIDEIESNQEKTTPDKSKQLNQSRELNREFEIELDDEFTENESLKTSSKRNRQSHKQSSKNAASKSENTENKTKNGEKTAKSSQAKPSSAKSKPSQSKQKNNKKTPLDIVIETTAELGEKTTAESRDLDGLTITGISEQGIAAAGNIISKALIKAVEKITNEQQKRQVVQTIKRIEKANQKADELQERADEITAKTEDLENQNYLINQKISDSQDLEHENNTEVKPESTEPEESITQWLSNQTEKLINKIRRNPIERENDNAPNTPIHSIKLNSEADFSEQLEQLNQVLTQIENRLDELENKITQIEQRLNRLEEQLNPEYPATVTLREITIDPNDKRYELENNENLSNNDTNEYENEFSMEYERNNQLTNELDEESYEVLNEESYEVLNEELNEELDEESYEVLNEELNEELDEELDEVLNEELNEELDKELDEELDDETQINSNLITSLLEYHDTHTMINSNTIDGVEVGIIDIDDNSHTILLYVNHDEEQKTVTLKTLDDIILFQAETENDEWTILPADEELLPKTKQTITNEITQVTKEINNHIQREINHQNNSLAKSKSNVEID